MNNLFKKGLLILVSIFLFFVEFPFYLKAESQTYIVAEPCMFLYRIGNEYNYVSFLGNSEIRIVYLTYRNDIYIWYVSQSTFKNQTKVNSSLNGSCAVASVNASSGTVNGHTYYYRNYVTSTSGDKEFLLTPISVDSTINLSKAVYYTFGEGAVDPEPPGPDWGNLVNVGYRTSIAGRGAAAVNNRDTFTWNNYVDSNGNEFTEDCKVQIRAFSGHYADGTVTGLLTKLYSDFVLDGQGGVQIAELSASATCSYTITWGTVVNLLNETWGGFMSPYNREGQWLKKGWVYKYRLIADNYQGEWQTIYTLTSSGVKNDLIVIDSENITDELIDVVIDITDIDIDIDIIIDIDDVIIPTPVPAPTASPDPSASPDPVPVDPSDPWWKYLLNAILDLIRSITKGIASIVSAILGLVSDLLGLFEFDAFSIPDINVHITNLFDNTGIIGDSLQFHDQLHTVLSQVEYAEPVLSFPGITLQNVQIIPQLEVNLNDYVTAFGLTNFRNIAYTVTDGGIYLSLVALIVRKVMRILQK